MEARQSRRSVHFGESSASPSYEGQRAMDNDSEEPSDEEPEMDATL